MLNWKHGWLAVCAGIALVSVALNVYLLTGSTAVTGGEPTELVVPTPSKQGTSTDAAVAVAEPINPALLEMLGELRQSVKATQEQVETLALRIPAKPEKAPPSAEEIARRETKRAEMRERLMLDLPEEERAVRHHERWLQENQEEVEALAREVEHLKQLSAESIGN